MILEKNKNKKTPYIIIYEYQKNLVIGMAGVYVFQLAGALSKLIEVEYIKYDEIKIYIVVQRGQ